MDFDSVLLVIGEFGRYQKTNYLLICLPVLFCAANSLSYVFTAGVPNYRCFVPGCDDPEAPIYDQHWVSSAVPGETDPFGFFKPEPCERYARIVNTSNHESCAVHSFDRHQQVRCDSWVFDLQEHTIAQDFLITCKENQWMLSLVGTMNFAGIVVGSGIAGLVADRYGRKNVFIAMIMLMSLTGIGKAISTNYQMFILFTFPNAIGVSAVFLLAFVISIEMVGCGKREMFGIVLNYFYAVGEAMAGLFAWLFGDWVTVQYLVSAPPLMFIVYYWIIPESARWLMAKKRFQEAGIIIRKAARINRKQLSNEFIQAFEFKSEKDLEMHAPKMISSEDESNTDSKQIWATLKQFISSRRIIVRFLIMFFIWTTIAFVYFGLSLNSTSFSGNKYLNFILVCLVEIPGYTLSWITMNKLGRRWSLAWSLLLSAVACIAGGFVPQNWTWLITILFLVGKLGVTSAYSTVFVYTAEMVPTVIRSIGVGSCSTVALLGALVAPFVPLLNYIYRPLPLLIFGSVSLIAGLLALLCLPETMGLPLPDTVEEAELLGQNKQETVRP